MNKLLIFLIFFLISCSTEIPKNKFDFYDTNISFEKFKIELEKYSKNNPYPNINN